MDGFGLPAAHVEVAAEIGMKYLAHTEHGNVSSHVRLEQACDATGGAVQPIYGCEMYVRGEEVVEQSQIKNHITVLAMNQRGYQRLLRLVTQSWGDNFYYNPTVSKRMVADACSTGDLAVLSGCTGSELASHIVGGKGVPEENIDWTHALNVAEWWKDNLPSGRYFLETQQFPELESTRTINSQLARMAAKLQLPLIATGDCHYPRPEDSYMQQILHNVRGGFRETLEQQDQRWGYNVPLCPPASDRDLLGRLARSGLTRGQALRAILTAESLGQDCAGVRLPALPVLRYPLPEGYEDATSLLHDQVREGWLYRGCHLLPGRERADYRARLAKELKVIEEKGYQDYFLVVGDVVRYCKEQQIPVGPARGSAAASIVCWLLRIIEVNPMLYPYLVFERFIDISRADMPDVDLDFDSRQRYKVFDYLLEKYGVGRVANMGSFTQYKPKLALDDVARVFRVPGWEIDKVKDVLVERSSGDLRASAGIEDTIAQYKVARDVFKQYPDMRHAMTLEGQYKGIGVHASGIAVASVDIETCCAIYRRKIESVGEMRDVISLDKWDAERQGVTKLDILGLNTMSMIADALRMLNMRLEDLYDLPLDDPDTINLFRHNDVTGVFQFEGRAMRSVTASVRPDTFLEIADITALARPGPLHNGAASLYADIKWGDEQITLVHPLYDGICAATYNLIVYQEQILKIVTEIGGFDWTAASHIRRIISKKLGQEAFNREWGRFWKGAKSKGVSKDTANTIWMNMITSGTYAFNFAHSVAYGMLAYWTGWLKVHHPQEFYAASLLNTKVEKKKNKHHELMRDAAMHGIDIRPPHPRHSGMTWKPAGKAALRAGWTQIPDIGPAKAEAIMSVEPKTFPDIVKAKGIGPKTLEKILAWLKPADPFKLFDLEERVEEGIARIKTLNGWIPQPTHTMQEVPEKVLDVDEPVVCIGTPLVVNLRSLYEINPATQRAKATPEETKDPELHEFVLIRVTDGTEQANFKIGRYEYPNDKDRILSLVPRESIVVMQGVRMARIGFRFVHVKRWWILGDGDDDDEPGDSTPESVLE
jgi:DNA polymerase III subunit alpha